MVFNTHQSPQNYYVYAYLREENSTPYYIGKGKGRRAYEKRRSIDIPKDKTKIIIIKDNLTEELAFTIESTLIWWYGRKDLNQGILRNLTDGGEGISNPSKETRNKMSLSRKGKPKSEEHKAKISASHKGKTHTEETREKLSEISRNRKYSDETRAKISSSNRGKIRSEESRARLSESKRGDKNPNFGKIPWNKK
jgi:hypothetical protein